MRQCCVLEITWALGRKEALEIQSAGSTGHTSAVSCDRTQHTATDTVMELVGTRFQSRPFLGPSLLCAKNIVPGTAPAVQWLESALQCRDAGLIPSQRTKTPRAAGQLSPQATTREKPACHSEDPVCHNYDPTQPNKYFLESKHRK